MNSVWFFKGNGYAASKNVENGNAYLLANGYMGCRGTLEEHTKAELAAVNLAGVYDQNQNKWRETVNAPNPLYGALYEKSGAVLSCESAASHTQWLDLSRAVSGRTTVWQTESGTFTYKTERFVSMAEKHLLASRYTLCSDTDMELTLLTGIDADVFDCNGPHLFGLALEEKEGMLFSSAHTGELNIPVCTGEAAVFESADAKFVREGEKLLRRIHVKLKAGVPFVLEKYGVVYTGKDSDDPRMSAQKLLAGAKKQVYDALLKAHESAWEALWEDSKVEIDGDQDAQRAINYSLYQLHAIAPRHGGALSVAARGLSGQTYKGAVFWDTEIFMQPFFLHTEPEVVRSFLKYRIWGLKGAKEKAREYGYDGAFYAWESQEEGAEACSDYNVTDVFTLRPQRTYFRDKQIHISGDIAYALWQYVCHTDDEALLYEGGFELLYECAKFYRSRAYRSVSRGTVEFLDVIGPDEYHERVSNNAFTNRMAKHTFETLAAAYAYLKKSDAQKAEAFFESLGINEKALAEFLSLARDIKPAAADKNGVIEQFDGYFKMEDCTLDTVRGRLLNEKEYWGGANGVAAHTAIIKQADVLTLMQLFKGDFTDEQVERNWRYYMPRTEHGSSLSACMYALTACRIGLKEEAYALFMKTAAIDMEGGGKQFAGNIYIGGTHPAASGGAWMTAVFGFAGFSVEGGEIRLKPALPEKWKRLRFRVLHGGRRYEITVTHAGTGIKIIE